MKHYVPITIIILAIGAFFFFDAIQEKARTVETEVESAANSVTINYPKEINIFSDLLEENGRTVLGDPVISRDKQFIIVETILNGTSDYDNSKTYLYDARNSRLHELKGRLSSNLQTTFWMTDYETNTASWYSIKGNEPELITTYFIGTEGFFDFLVSPNEKLTAISGGGLSIIDQSGEVHYLDSAEGARAEAWASDSANIYALVPDPNRDLTNPLEEFYGPQDYLIKEINITKEGKEIASKTVPYSSRSPRELEWFVEDSVLLVNSGFDDGSFDEILHLNDTKTYTIGDTSGALVGRYIDQQNELFIVAGEFYPEDYVFEQTDDLITQEFRIYDSQGSVIYQYFLQDNEYLGIQIIGYSTNVIYFSAQKEPGAFYIYGALDTETNEINQIGQPSTSYVSAEFLNGSGLLSVGDDRIEYIKIN
ncbi:hypothetical protein CL684_01360 [Candidatus Campbellbacteria bacterium]|nr:hypothetical protein [Candidatus Campbellbacteria bacterium]|tara:strand:- start:505 stop:1773 length:1269 start_codon:yes stop_codon:yes gene_type:complete